MKAFLFSVAKNACFDLIKAREKLKVHPKDLAYVSSQLDEDTFLRAIIQSELLQEINNEIEKLPARCKEIFKLLFHEGMDAKEVAIKLNISTDTVYQQKIIAIKRLRDAPVAYILMLFWKPTLQIKSFVSLTSIEPSIAWS